MRRLPWHSLKHAQRASTITSSGTAVTISSASSSFSSSRFFASSSSPSFFGSIDQGTSSSRFIVYDEKLQPVASHQSLFDMYNPKPGWAELDPSIILESVETCINAVLTSDQAKERGITAQSLSGIGITNQRETTIVWNRKTGQPLYNALVWLDTRTSELVDQLTNDLGGADVFRLSSGLPLSTYFSAVKLLWLLKHVPEVKEAYDTGELMFGTVDSWLIWNMTGGVEGGIHATDVTNASRSLLMDLTTCDYNASTLEALNLHHHHDPSSSSSLFPEIRSCSEFFGNVSKGVLKGVPISGCIGDQQSATVGQMCFQKGSIKNTFGTGSFLLLNTGEDIVQSSHGLLTTPCYKLGADAPTVYSLEGAVAIAGVGIKWLQDDVNLFDSPIEMNQLAESVEDNNGVYFVPALSGLLAPYWEPNARGTIVGLSQSSTRAHICRAMLEALAYQVNDVVNAMKLDFGSDIKQINVDGGVTKSELLNQIVANVLGIKVWRPQNVETTALGAGIAAAIGAGRSDIVEAAVHRLGADGDSYESNIDESERQRRQQQWKRAVQCCLGFSAPHQAK